ncbi:MAG TPA: tetratricopeptide repeat protein [Steroidobacteraceae bacterium]|nr:tetratricopeptide repeat protein [Steroidobacteraceae bacterium]
MQRRSLQWFAALVGVWACAQAAAAVTDADRLQVYKEFREAFDARRYAEALPLAEKIVAMTEEQYGSNDRKLANPLTNLGTVHYRMKDYAAAEKDYQRSVEILEQTGGNADRQLLRPLHGLGAAHFAKKEYVDASVALKRAVDLSRNLDGLFNVDQLQMLEPLIASYVALDLTADAEKEQQYALRVAESAYGKNDARMLKPLDRYGRWLEQIGRYTTARLLYARALTIAEATGGRGSPLGVDALQGIARTYRLEFVNGAEETPTAPDPFGANDTPIMSEGQRLNPDGERALRLALSALDKVQPVDHKKRGEVLVELGDWYFSAGAMAKGLEVYREAWKDLAAAHDTSVLEQPRMLAYRPPPSSAKRSHLNPDESEERYTEVKYTVTKEGRTDNVTIVSGDAAESTQKAVVSAMKKARYAPRFENGEPVDTPDVVWREKLLVRVKQQSAKTS